MKVPFSTCNAFHSCHFSRPTSLLYQNLRVGETLNGIVSPSVTGEYRSLTAMVRSDASRKLELEVEQKFSLDSPSAIDSIETRLSSLGFKKCATGAQRRFTDCYFDLPSPHWTLTMHDCWLRYRDDFSEAYNVGGKWQLKIGRMLKEQYGGNRATVYEEIEGDEAVVAALSIIDKASTVSISDSSDGPQPPSGTISLAGKEGILDGQEIPTIPGFGDSYNLIPFARFMTTRTGWTYPDDGGPESSMYAGITVDIDSADFGFAVGEVEVVVEREEDVPRAKEKVSFLLQKLDVENSGSHVAPPGKLETYMKNKRRHHYDACVKGKIF